LLLATAAAVPRPAAPSNDEPADPVRRGRRLRFPRDHGAHLGQRIEWWYASGALQAEGIGGPVGFQVTFFRLRTGLAADLPGRFAPRHLIFAHAALSLPSRGSGGTHLHAQRIARWSGADDAGARVGASVIDADLRLDGWRLWRTGRSGDSLDSSTALGIDAGRFAIRLNLQRRQPLLLQGEAGFSRKGPLEVQASHYYSEPQLEATGEIVIEGQRHRTQGRAWIDHEWADELLAPEAVGWDWVGFNLDDGSALTAFRLRHTDQAAPPVWSGGSLRRPGAGVHAFDPGELRFTPLRRWRSPATQANYPVQWQLETPAGRHTVRALMDGQELDGRGATGTVYWEGLSELLDDRGKRVGLGYLEMTGYAGRLRL
jgi:predicted secreted hydrolase